MPRIPGHCTAEVRARVRTHLGEPAPSRDRAFETWRLERPGRILWAPTRADGDGPSRLYVTLDDGYPFLHFDIHRVQEVEQIMFILQSGGRSP